jgi:hypothetical protein
MNEKVQAILLKVVVELKKLQWYPGRDWEVTLKGEGHVPLVKQVSVEGNLGDEEWRDEIETALDIKLMSDDEITFFPEYTIYSQISIPGGPTKDVLHKMDADIAFTENDLNNEQKHVLAARKINRLVESHMQEEYGDYIDQNENEIMAYKQGGWKADYNPDR